MNFNPIYFSSTQDPIDSASTETPDSAGHDDGGEGHDKSSDVIFFIFSALCLGGIVKEINKKTAIPYTPMLFVIGVFMGKYKNYLGILEGPIEKMGNIDGHGLLMIFLPVLIFEGGFSCDWHLFRRQFFQIVILAFPAVVVSAFMLAFCLKVILFYDDTYYTWTGAFMFGSILSCTDTVAVLALLKEAGASKKFNSLIEGESLINDGTCMILYQISSAMMKGKAAGFGAAMGLFFSLTLGGMALGLLFGGVCTLWIKKIFNDEVLVVNITFLTCYLLFYVAENIDFGFKISGIIALVTLGLFMSAFGKTRISSEADHAVHTFWKYIVFCAETVIFLLAGILVGIDVISESGTKHLDISDYYKVLGLYLCMLVVRFSAIAIFMPFLSKIAYGLTWVEVIALAYGGLRGAIGIAFALIVANDNDFPIKFRSIVLFQMAGAAVLTLIINGTTTGLLIRKLGMVTTTNVKRRYQIHFTQKMLEEIDNKIEEIKNDRFLNVVDWDKVKQFNCIDEYNKFIHQIEDQIKNEDKERHQLAIQNQGNDDNNKRDLELSLMNREESNHSIGNEDGQEEDLDEASVTEARNKFLMALKGSFWELFEVNQISGDSLILLMQAANFDIDNAGQRMNSWEFISMGLINKQYMNTLFKLKFTPLIGRIARNLLFNHISSAYDIVIGYIESHEKAEAIFRQFPLDERIITEIVTESNESKESAERYLHNYLTVSFPEITQQIQNKKAATTVLEQQKTALNENLKTGQIEEREYQYFKKSIDNSVKTLGDLVPDWHMPPIREFLKQIPFFQYLDDKTINNLLLEAKDYVFENDVKIIKELDKANEFFVITRGCGMETTSKGNYREKKGVGSTISTIHIIQSTFKYQTTFISESLFYVTGFKMSTIQKIVKNTPALLEYSWKDSLRVLVKMYSEELRPLSSLDTDSLNELITDSTFKKYKKNSIIDFAAGGIFLRGQAVEKIEEQPLNPSIHISPPTINVLNAQTPNEKKSSFSQEGQIETIKEEDEVAENRPTKEEEPSNFLKVTNIKEPEPVGRSFKFNVSGEREGNEGPKSLTGLFCLMPNTIPNLFTTQKSCLVLHFSKSEETERILNLDKMSEKNWMLSMAMKPKKSSIRRSRKDLKFGQTKGEKKEVNI